MLFLILPNASFAENVDEPVETGETAEAEEVTEEASEPDIQAEENRIDKTKRQMDTQVQRAAQWVDSFYGDPNYEAEVASTQLRIRPEYYYRKEQGGKIKGKVSLRLMLPNTGNKISLIAGNDLDEFEDGGAVDDDDDDAVIGLQFFGKKSKGWHSSLTAGIKFNDVAGIVGPRFRYRKAFNDRSSYRFTQSFRWQTNNYWQINSRLDLNYVVSDRFFFRQTFDGRWRGEDADEEGYRTRVSSFLTQRLENMAGLQYEFSTIFHTKPDNHVDRYTVAVRYRKQAWREWFYYEIVPQLSFEDKYDFKANPGIRLRFEVFFGGNKDQQFNKRQLEDTEDFRW